MSLNIYSKAGADAAFATAAQGALADATEVEQVTLTAPLAYTLPVGTPANTVHRVTFTQDASGGHTVTYDSLPLTVDLTAGASTLVELHPVGTGYVVRYPVVDLGASLSSTYAPRNATTAITLTTASQAITLPVGALAGDTHSLVITADGGTPDWDALIVWDAGIAPTLSAVAGERDVLTFLHTGDDWLGFVSGLFAALPAAPDTEAPTVPANLTATAASSTAVDLSWTASTDNVAVTGYEYRIDGGAAVDAGAGTTETVTGLTAATEYDFELRAYDAAGNASAWSTAATETTDAAPAAITDSFDRADSTTTLGTTDTGETWKVVSGVWGIDTNRAYRVSGEIANRPTAYVEWGSAEMAVSAKFTGTTGTQYFACVARWVDVQNCYQIVLGISSSNAKELLLSRRIAGTTANLFAMKAWAAGDVLGASFAEEAGGTRVNFYKNGALIDTTLDSTAGRPMGTKAGLMHLLTSGTGDMRADDFAVVAP